MIVFLTIPYNLNQSNELASIHNSNNVADSYILLEFSRLSLIINPFTSHSNNTVFLQDSIQNTVNRKFLSIIRMQLYPPELNVFYRIIVNFRLFLKSKHINNNRNDSLRRQGFILQSIN